MQVVDKKILDELKKQKNTSHKGENGRLLVIAGSEKYHGALLLAIGAASRIVDMVYVHSTSSNLELVKDLKQQIATFIGVTDSELKSTIELVDAVLIGPGLPEDDETINLTKSLLTEHNEKKIVVDATALWHVDPAWLHKNSVVTPHSREFEHVFGSQAVGRSVLEAAKKYSTNIVLTGKSDYISDGETLWENTTGNSGMTKGGTGDVLSGAIAALMCKNEPIISALAGTYINGIAGDSLYEKFGTFYNAEDLMREWGSVNKS